MDETAQLSAVISTLYDAALDPGQWGIALAEARDFVGGAAASIFAKDVAHTRLTVFQHDGRVAPEYVTAYLDRYMALDPANTVHFFSEIEVPVSTVDVIAFDEFHETRFYKEWAKPQGLVDFVTIALEKTPTGAAHFGVFRGAADGIVDEPTRRRMALLAPHVRRAVLIGRTLEVQSAQAVSFAETFDGMSAALFLVQANGRIVHANAAATALLAGSGFVQAAGDRIAFGNARAQQALAEVLARAERGDTAVGNRGVSLHLATRDGAAYMAHVLPLTSGARRMAGSAFAAVAAIFIRRAGLDLPATPEIIARHYGLTPSELRVLLAVVEVGGVPDVAEALGVAETTVKTHLGNVFGKTGTSRQADLVKL
ncbi:MAG: LuxR family transcriptional regulator, partial [Rhizobiales bacterium]|nr:LuxR family transcriptional regulator [Hyphomicrobiales bacterium]